MEHTISFILNKNNINHIKSLYPLYNAKILLSSFLIFEHYIQYNISFDLYITTKQIYNSLKFEKYIPPSLYVSYIVKFNYWKLINKNTMLNDINNMSKSLENTIISNPLDDADLDWNVNIEKSLVQLEKSIKFLS